MSSDTAAASFLDRVNTLSFPAVAGVGAAAGLLAAVLSALSVESQQAQGHEHGAASAPATQAPAADPDADDAAKARSRPIEAEQEPAKAATKSTAEKIIENSEDGPADTRVTQDVGTPPREEDPDTPDAGKPSQLSPSEPPVGSAPGRTQADRDAEAKMDADELLTAAAEAYRARHYKDAYRLATRSQRARPRSEAQMLRGRSACRLRDQKNARGIVRSFKLGDEHRKTLRAFCRDRGVRVGL